MPDPKPSFNPWPVALIAFFAIFISSVVAFAIFAIGQPVDLVKKDYYSDEIRFQTQIDREARTRPLTNQIAVLYNPSAKQIQIQLPSAHAASDLKGTVQLYRPSNASLDRNEALVLNAQGVQQLNADRLEPGRWQVKLRWSTQGEEFSFDQPILIEVANSAPRSSPDRPL